MAYWLTTLLAGGAPGWLNLLVLLCVWSGIKMLWLGPISLILLARARIQEFAARSRQMKNERAECDSEVAMSGARG
jgi:cytochrome c-type biogenesis protein CcmH/NrfF